MECCCCLSQAVFSSPPFPCAGVLSGAAAALRTRGTVQPQDVTPEDIFEAAGGVISRCVGGYAVVVRMGLCTRILWGVRPSPCFLFSLRVLRFIINSRVGPCERSAVFGVDIWLLVRLWRVTACAVWLRMTTGRNGGTHRQ